MEDYIHRFAPLWGEWTPVDALGQGSFGTVWLVRRQDGTEGAVKEIVIPFHQVTLRSAQREGLTEEGAKVYFRRLLSEAEAEIRLMQALSGCETVVRFRKSQVQTLTGEGEFGWVIHILMDRLVPFSLRWTDGLTVRDAAQMAIDIAEALEACQDVGIIHRDIKPDNLFYDPRSGRYQLGDFGIARYLERPTEGKGRAGTLTHMPPEVYQGAPHTCGADLYALGMILYRLLNDNRIPLLPPFPEDFGPQERDRATVQRLRGAAINAPAILGYAAAEDSLYHGYSAAFREEERCLARSLGHIAARAIASDPEERFPTATDFRKAMETALGQCAAG